MSSRIVTQISVIVAFVLMASLFSTAAQPVEIQIRGRFFTEPATVRVTVAVEPNADNRLLRIEADGDRLFRSSEVVLEGDQDRRLHSVEFKNLPAGQYTLRAEVLTSGSSVRGVATQELYVMGVQR